MKCRAQKPGEEGYVLLGVIILLALFVIAMAVAAPRVADDIRRDREVETMHRGKQYIRAIQLYYRKFHAYPPNIDALVKTNEIRFLRKRYTDPMTGKDDWKPVFLGQNKTPMAMGFFGQPLGGTGGNVIAGIGPGGMPGSSTPGTDTSTSGTTQTTTTGTGTTSPTGTDSSDSSNGFMGGGSIIGVTPVPDKKSILIYKKMDHYNTWEFLYSPLMDQPGAYGMTTGSPSGTSPNGNNGILGSGGSTTPSTPSTPAPTPQQ